MKRFYFAPVLCMFFFLQSCVTNYVVAEPSLYTTSYKSNANSELYGKKFVNNDIKLLKTFTNDAANHAKDQVLLELQKKEVKSKKKSIINNLLNEAKTFLGTPYRYGGMTRRGIDCSAFVLSAYRALGLKLPRVAASQATKGEKVAKSDLKKGDLLFFANSRRISHVGMVESVSEDGEIFFIHASSSKGVTITSLDKSSYWTKRFRYGKRIITDSKFEELIAKN